MADTTQVAIKTLNKLLEIAEDGEHGYKTAADGLKNPDLRRLFLEYSQQRTRIIEELREEARRLGGDPKDSGTLAGKMHRGWINLKSAAAGEDEAAVIAEVERGEDAAVRTYEEALEEEGLPPDVRAMIERQYAQIKVAHDRIRDLEKAHQA